MPYPTAKHSMVGMGMFEKVISIGGYIKHNLYTTPLALFEMTCKENTCSWSSMKQNITEARDSFTSFLIPDDFVSCEKSNMQNVAFK